MKQDRDWIDAMRGSLRQAELEPPKGGWERLAGQIATPAKPRGSFMRIYWPRIAAAAAAVIMFVVAGDYLLHDQIKDMTDGEVITPLAVGSGGSAAIITPIENLSEVVLNGADGSGVLADLSASAAIASSAVSSASTQGVALSERLHRAAERAVGRILIDGVETVEFADNVLNNPQTQTQTQTQPQSQPQTHAQKTKIVSENLATKGEDVDRGPDSQTAQLMADGASRRTSGRRFATQSRAVNDMFADSKPKGKVASVGLFAAGGMMGGKGGTAATRLSADNMITTGGPPQNYHRYNYSGYSFRHRLPLSVGLALRKEFKYGLSLESGVNYTLLSSDVKVAYGAKDITQKLHFIGVPLRMNWTFWEHNRFSMYASAGGMVEKCVGAKLGSEKLDIQPIQWSIMAAVGAQYRLGGVVGIFFEPELSYYFTKTQMRTSRTDSPLNVTMRLGLRFNL